MNRNDQYILVYCTLRRVFDHPLSKSISKNTEYLGEAFFQGLLYEVSNFPGAIAVSDSDRKITGELYRINNQPELFGMLDQYEGYHSNFPVKSLFIRAKKNVTLKTGKSVQAWVYLYNRSVVNLNEIKSGDYVNYSSKEDLQ